MAGRLMEPYPELNQKYERHFRARYVVQNNGCWMWTARLKKNGYGRFSMHGKDYLAHRMSYTVHRGQPGRFYVCHTCDTPSCINPDHLFLGTQDDNMNDCVKKGRHYSPRGRAESCPLGHPYREGFRTCITCSIVRKEIQKVKRVKNG